MIDDGLVARNDQIIQIEKFITSKVDKKQSGILYLTGPPGTGKTMCIQLVLNRLREIPRYKDVKKIDINCMKIQSARTILRKICEEAGLGAQLKQKTTEVDMMAKLTKKFSGRTCDTYLFVMDEIDQLPKSKNLDLIRTIFSWPSMPLSRLVLVGISNTFNLTSRREAMSWLNSGGTPLEKILFKPYTAADIKSILEWYIENNENYQDVEMDPKALDMISKKCAKENGDIRGALNACKSTMDDVVKADKMFQIKSSGLHVTSTPLRINDFWKVQKTPRTPVNLEKTLKLEFCNLPDTTTVTTPPPSPKPRAKATLPSVATSIKKRQKSTNYEDDVFPFSHQIVLFCVISLASTSSKQSSIELQKCFNIFLRLGARFSITETRGGFQSIIESLETQGLIQLKKARGKNPSEKIVMRGSESEINSRILRREMISDAYKFIRG